MERIEKFEFPEDATPLSDYSDLIPAWVRTMKDLNRVEAENILEAQRSYLNGAIDKPQKWFKVKELKSIHMCMFGNVWKWAGRYRKTMTSIGIKPHQIPIKLAELCHLVETWFQYPTELTFVEMSAVIHHQLVFIHPFENGNGRFSRLVADCFLYSCKCTFPEWPHNLNQNGKERKEYIQALKQADKGDVSSLILLMKRYGASDPKLNELLKIPFYKQYLVEEKGIALVKALLRNGANTQVQVEEALPLANKAGLEKIATLLAAKRAE